nr:NADH dehydrogenase subunit 5 [Odontocerum albicorne]
MLSSILLLLISLLLFLSFLIAMSFKYVLFIEWEIFTLNSMELVYIILLDWMSLLFMSIVMFISSMVIYYSDSYMMMDLSKERFLILVLLFVFSMMLMIISPNLISIMLGWDGLGLVSFCLVIYYQNVKSYYSGMLTVLSNRVGDVMILMSIALMLNYDSWNLIFYMSYYIKDNLLLLVMFLLILASFTKSAQIPFSAWLPAAMAAPTPVSALVHSSTLVTAGVYLLIRFYNFFKDSYVFKLVLLIGVLTMFMSGMAANYEFDLKKIIALSTLSQLGLMMSILGMNFENLAFFHLLAHAFFKALMFLCAGVLIHNFKDMQDIRFLGSAVKFLPMVSISFLISNMALCGLPFLTGFYSKDMILDNFSMCNLNMFIYVMFYMSMGLTVSYSVRVIWYSFFMSVKFFSVMNLCDQDFIMMKSIICLTMMSIFGGSMLSNLIFDSFQLVYLSMNMKFMIIYMIVLGSFGGMLVSLLQWNFLNYFSYFNSFMFSNMWFLESLSLGNMSNKILFMSFNLVKVLDLGWLEYLFSLNIFGKISYYMVIFQKFQKSNIKLILLMFFLVVLIMVSLINF